MPRESCSSTVCTELISFARCWQLSLSERQKFTACLSARGEKTQDHCLCLLLGTKTGCSVDSRSLLLISSRMPSVGLGGCRHSPWLYEASSQEKQPVISHLFTQINRKLNQSQWQPYNRTSGSNAEGFHAEAMIRQKSQG